MGVQWWWSWLLTAVGVLGLYFAGRKDWRGWAVGLGAQVLWVLYAVFTQQWGFLASAFCYGAVYWLNLWRWTHSQHPDLDTESRAEPVP